ncbi:MAG: hypothetical protein C0601_09595 [Candidatus Muiribacterium halophilum]|uniref:beta-N-acetylhexosaminidase n=1 Tax=Muiribacterium halophilum TaxID=2053465 RepID=A0A2N5ZDI1_MUIH1|nr:MAG: hypothetical protein C0601_09595 [Candidatus Muirbacterium halophilum]
MNINSFFEEKLIYPLFDNKKEVLFQAFFYIDHYNARLFDITPARLSGPGEIKSCITEIKKRRPDSIVFLRHGTGGQETIKKNIDMTPSNRALGLIDEKKSAFDSGLIIAKELKSIGIDIIISDFLGININKENPIIGVRSFSDDPNKVSEFAKEYKKGIEKGGLKLVACGFPGKGALSYYHKDKITTYKRDLDSMYMDELIPYVNIIKEHMEMIELSDLYYFLESNTVHEPATLSSSVIDYLRKPLSYSGKIISFPIYNENFSSYEGLNLLRRCIEAGCDIVYLPGNLKKNIEILDNIKVLFSTGRFQFQVDFNKLKTDSTTNEESLYYIKKKNSHLLEKIEDSIALRLESKDFETLSDVIEPFVVVPKQSDDKEEKENYFFKSIKYYKRKSKMIEYSYKNSEEWFEKTIKKLKDKEVIIISEGVYSNKHLQDLFLKIIKNASSAHVIGVSVEYEEDIFSEDTPYFCIGTSLESTFKRVVKEIFKNRY